MPHGTFSSRLAASLIALAACAAAVQTALAQVPRPGGEPPLDVFGQGAGIAAERSGVEMSLAPEKVAPGGEVTVTVTIRVPPASYTYSTNPAFGGRTRIDIKEAVGLEPLGDGFAADHEPKVEFQPEFNQEVEKFVKDVTWTRKYRVLPNAAGRVSLTGKLRYQVCDARTCRPLSEEIALAAAVEGASDPFVYDERPTLPPNDQPGPVTVRAELSPQDARPGERVTLSVRLTLDEGWHTYAIWEEKVLGASPTKIEIKSTSGLKPLGEGFQPDHPPERKELEDLGVVHEVFHDAATWTRQFEVTEPGYQLKGSIRYQACTSGPSGKCLLPRTIAFTLGGEAKIEAAPAATEAAPAATEAAAAGPDRSAGLVPFIIGAVIAGFAALLTPCVFPMVPITVSFFLKQSESRHHQPLTMALVYCGSIMATFTVIGVVIAGVYTATDLNALANHGWLNIFIAGVLVFFGLNLLGLFELRMPGWLLTWTAGKESQGGLLGTVFMGLTFTLVSFTCTFAFVGGLLVWASQGEVFWPVVGMLAFSGAFALPFFFLALFPSYLKKLPKSGGWMNTVKVTMAMIEIGAAFKFLSVADLAWNPVAKVFDASLVLSAWFVIAAATGLYLLGQFRLPHDTASDSISVPRFLFAMSFLGLAGYLAVGLFAPEKPSGKLWDLVYSQLPPRYESGRADDLGPYLEEGGLKYALNFEQALQFARQTNQPVFIDFTGENCANCRLMEKRMQQPQLHERLQKFVRVKVYADSIPTYSDPEESLLLEKNRRLQVHSFGDVSLPSYAIVTPFTEVAGNGGIRLDILAKRTGQTDERTFGFFLDEGLSKWQRVAERGDARTAALVGYPH